jgi:O-methyltransferase involved in polyketide biosynthesis
MKTTVNKSFELSSTRALEWKGYDPDRQAFFFSGADGGLYFVSLKDMQNVVAFIDKESEKKPN